MLLHTALRLIWEDGFMVVCLDMREASEKNDNCDEQQGRYQIATLERGSLRCVFRIYGPTAMTG